MPAAFSRLPTAVQEGLLRSPARFRGVHGDGSEGHEPKIDGQPHILGVLNRAHQMN